MSNSSEGELTNVRVVITDDHAVVRAGLAAIIDAEPGMLVAGEAGDGTEAVRVARAARADVLLMDISMPGTDGLAGLELMRRELPAVAVIMLTTFNIDDHIARALRAGAAGYLLKTASMHEITAAIRSAHRGERTMSPLVQDRLVDAYLRGAARPPAPPPVLGLLTEREMSVFVELAHGKSNAEIAAALFLSEATVKTYVTRILGKLELRNRVQAVVFALRHGVIAFDDEP